MPSHEFDVITELIRHFAYHQGGMERENGGQCFAFAHPTTKGTRLSEAG